MTRMKDGANAIVVKPYDGSGEEVEVCKVTNRSYVDWTVGGRYILGRSMTWMQAIRYPTSSSSLSRGKNPPSYDSRSKFDEYEASILPNGKWIAYLTN